jgi:1-aminocyclopropane-1-carboxylate deaminase
MDIINTEYIPIQPLDAAWYAPHVAAVDMLRLDMIHPVISGNKWFKLQYNIQAARQQGCSTLVTFGGGYSNHLVAAAAAAALYNISSIGIIRGIYNADNETDAIIECKRFGMQLLFVSQQDYDRKDDPEWVRLLLPGREDIYIIPEGGANEEGRIGAEAIAQYIPAHYTHICVCAGTGTTLTGIRNALPPQQHIIGFAPMKGGVYLKEEIKKHIKNSHSNWDLLDEWHVGGFGKINDSLIQFMNDFYIQHHIPLDRVYTAKMMYGLQQLLQQSYFPLDAKILCIHSGGLQGNSSIYNKLVFGSTT